MSGRDPEGQGIPYQALFDSNPLPLWLYDVETLRFLAVNDAACAKYGYSREEFLGMTLRDIRLPGDIEPLEAAIAAAPREGPLASVWRHRLRDQSIIDVEVTSQSIAFAGRLARLVCPLDVTQKVLTEKAGEDARARFRAVVEQSIFGIYLAEKSKMTYVNPHLCEILGYPAETFLSMDITSLFVGEDLKFVRDLVARRDRGEKGWIVFECKARHAEGRLIDLKVESKVILVGGVEVAMGVVRDITRRVTAVNALRESELRFRQLADNISEVFFIQDLHTMQDIYVSPAYEKIWGRTRESHFANQAGAQDALHPDDRERVLGNAEQRRVTGRFEHEYRIVRPDGSIRWIHSSGFPIQDESGALYRIAGVAQDVTERRLAEEEVKHLNATLERRVAQRTEELETANLELEAFDYSISHDLRAPMRHITGLTGALLADCADKLDARSLDHLHRLNRASQKMDGMVADLMRLSTLTRGEPQRERIDVSALAESVIAELRRAHPERQVTVVIAPGIVAQADRGLLHIALENLLGNAWKYTGGRERATIEVGQLVSNGDDAIFVRDDGAGFDMEYADKLFAPFRRLHTESQFPGTGIGLATVQRIVRLHGGRIWAEAAVDAGATFHFTLSGAKAAAP